MGSLSRRNSPEPDQRLFNVPDQFKGLLMPEGPTEVIQARIDALAARMKSLGLIVDHWVNRGIGTMQFSLEDVERHMDTLALRLSKQQGNSSVVLDAEYRELPPDPKNIEGPTDNE